jgi:hypothetical protein
LKSAGLTPYDWRYKEAGEVRDILPAGEIWSVVIELPNNNKQWAFLTSFI